MKGPLDRTKVVLRHLPPAISQAAVMEQIDCRFGGRYNWVSFRPGKNSLKRQSYSRAYIAFRRPEDVVDFAEFFDGHVFVNEKGAQFRMIVEYAPSQRVPKQWSKKDGRDGTIFKDPEFLEFVDFLAKPVENLPSAEIQLEKKEAERAGAAKEAPIITPLMDFIRQKIAAKGGSQRSLSNRKPSKRAGGALFGSPSSASSKRSYGRRISTTMYISRDTTESMSSKDKSMSTLVPKRNLQRLPDKSVNSAAKSVNEIMEEESGVTGTTNIGEKKILLLRGKEKEIPNVSGEISLQQSARSPIKSSLGSTSLKQNKRREASGRLIGSILLNKDSRQSQSLSVVQSEQQNQTSTLDEGKRPPRPPNVQLFLKDANGVPEDRVVGNDVHCFGNEKLEKRARNKDRPDCGVWTPLRHSDGSHSSEESLSSSRHVQLSLGLKEGSHKKGGRRGLAHSVKDVNASLIASEGKPLKRVGSSGHGSLEKQVWVQKPSSGS